ncbi:hypothetical protein FPQ18DRAFT_305391 [Pyronema domesticum]|nr:hypothetical protein FPQ18DRAFT_305391 [Pyronema domesticum]
MSLLFPFSSLSFFVAPVIVIVAVVEDVVVEFNDKYRAQKRVQRGEVGKVVVVVTFGRNRRDNSSGSGGSGSGIETCSGGGGGGGGSGCSSISRETKESPTNGSSTKKAQPRVCQAGWAAKPTAQGPTKGDKVGWNSPVWGAAGGAGAGGRGTAEGGRGGGRRREEAGGGSRKAQQRKQDTWTGREAERGKSLQSQQSQLAKPS